MELKTTLNLEVIKNERAYRLSIPLGAPYGEAYDAVFSCLQSILEMQNKSVEQLKAQAAQSVSDAISTPAPQRATENPPCVQLRA